MKIIEKYLDKEGGINRELTFKFFMAFSRFEYALKRTGYLKRRGKDNNVQPNWCKFASSLVTKFDECTTKELQSAVKYLQDNPPKKQVVEGGRLSWKDAKGNQGQQTIELLIIYIKTVRNNLFHGGKFSKGPLAEPARNKDLLSNSLIILNRCLELDTEVQWIFLESEK